MSIPVIHNLKSDHNNRGVKNFNLFSVFFLLILPNEVKAGTIVNAPKGFGLSAGLVGYWTFDGSPR